MTKPKCAVKGVVSIHPVYAGHPIAGMCPKVTVGGEHCCYADYCPHQIPPRVTDAEMQGVESALATVRRIQADMQSRAGSYEKEQGE